MRGIIGRTLAALAIALFLPVIGAQALPLINSETQGSLSGGAFQEDDGADINFEIGNPGGPGEIFTFVIFVPGPFAEAAVTDTRMGEGWMSQTINDSGEWDGPQINEGCGGPCFSGFAWSDLFAPFDDIALGFFANGFRGLGFFLAAPECFGTDCDTGKVFPLLGSHFQLQDPAGTILPNTMRDGFVGVGLLNFASPTFFASLNPQGGNPLLTTFDVNQTQVPEPGTLALFAFGLLGFGAMRRRRRLA